MVTDTAGETGLGDVIPARPSDAPARTLLSYQKVITADEAQSDTVHLQARGAEGEAEWHWNLFEIRFNSFDGSAGVLSFRECTSCITALKLYDGPLHNIALD